jgi:O-antigen ligase
VGAVVLITLTATFLPTDYLQIPLGSHPVGYNEATLAGLLVIAIAWPRHRTWGGVPGGLLAAFLAIVALSTLLAIQAGKVSLSDGVQWGRAFFMLTIFWVVVRLFGDRESLRRLMLVASIAAGVSGLVALLIANGTNLSSVLGDAAMFYVNQGLGIGSLARIRLPGLALGYPLFWYVALHLTRTKGIARMGWLLILLGVVINLAVSLNRNMWAGLLVGLVGLVIVGGVRVRRPLAVAIVSMASAIALIAIVGVQVDRGPLQPFVERGSTLLSPGKTTQENSLQDRGKETREAWRTFKEHPVVGIGAGTAFGVYFDEQQAGNLYKRTRQLFLHNQYLYLLLIAGVPGALCFVGWMGLSALAGRRYLWDPDVSTWTIGIGMIALSAVVMISFADAASGLALGLIAGAVVAGSANLREEEDDDVEGEPVRT